MYNDVQPITSFRGEHFFLSNYFTAPFTWRGYEFQSGEQAFAYAKVGFTTDGNQASNQHKVMGAKTPGAAKAIGRGARIDVDEWDSRKVQYMREITHAKFSTGEGALAGKLINTGAAMLIEGNDWGDQFWGRCYVKTPVGWRWEGLNVLGAILMEERGVWLRGTPSNQS